MRKKLQDTMMDAAVTGPRAAVDIRGQQVSAGSGVRESPRAERPGDTVTTGLQKLFASIAEEPIPDDFMRLLDDIDASASLLSGKQSGRA